MDRSPTAIPRILEASLFETLADGVSEGVYYVTSDHTVLFWNKQAEHISGYSQIEITGMACSDSILHVSDEINCARCSSQCPLAATLNDGQVREVDAFIHKKNGQRVPAKLRCSPVRDLAGKIQGTIEVFRETGRTDPLKELQKLRHEANTDALTGIGNRRLAELLLAKLQAEQDRESPPFGVVFFDIDRFKEINDSWGHLAGDQVLRQTARVVKKALRSIDALCRWGGEEFLALVPEITPVLAAEIGERVRRTVEETQVSAHGEALRWTISVGVTLHRSGEKAIATVQRADELMYASKSRGRNRVSLEID